MKKLLTWIVVCVMIGMFFAVKTNAITSLNESLYYSVSNAYKYPVKQGGFL